MKVRLPVLRTTLSLVLLLTMILSALPQPAQAATCASYYTVKEGDTPTKIAQKFDLKWREIADANNLEYPYDLEVGQRLCIPPKDSDEDDEDATKFKWNVTASKTSITITLSGLSVKKAGFNVRARNAQTGVGGWIRLGHFKAKKNTSYKIVYSIPKELMKVLYIQVCLKNVTTDELACKIVVHP
jgi:LysM repeat protein